MVLEAVAVVAVAVSEAAVAMETVAAEMVAAGAVAVAGVLAAPAAPSALALVVVMLWCCAAVRTATVPARVGYLTRHRNWPRSHGPTLTGNEALKDQQLVRRGYFL